MELKELKTKLENSSLMDAMNGHVLSFTQIQEKDEKLSGNISLEDESGDMADKESTFVIYKNNNDLFLKTDLFTNHISDFTFVLKKYAIEITLINNPNSNLNFNYIINTN